MHTKQRSKTLDEIFNLEEYYSLEDYGNYKMIQSSITTIYDFDNEKNDKKNQLKIRINFMVYKDEKVNEKEEIIKKNDLKKIYSIIKINSEDSKFIKIFLLREKKYNPNDILNRINNMRYFKGPIKIYLNIDEFPLKSYLLEEENNQDVNQDVEAVFCLKKILPKAYNNIQMMNNNQMNFNCMSMNQINNNNLMNNNFQMNQNEMNNMLINQFGILNQNMMNLMNQFQNNYFLNNNSQNNKQNDRKESINDLINTESTNEIVDFLKNNREYDKFFPLIGMQNVGLTCYMNSILQCLLHIPELNAFFIKLYPERKNEFMKINNDCETNGRLCEEYYNIVKKVFENNNNNKNKIYNIHRHYNRNDSIAPIAFNKLLSNLNPQFARYESNDAKDLLLYLFQAMHSELNYYGDKRLKNVPKCNQLIENESFKFFMTVNKSLNLSIFSHLFYGITKSITKCSKCKNKLYNFQFIQFLSFPTFEYKNNYFNLYRGFKDYIKTEKMEGDNQCYCQFCKGLKNSLVKTKIFIPPIYLLINIDYGKDKKYLPSSINFGSFIDIKDFIDNNYKGCTQYKLISVTTHIGHSGNSGHYISYCRNSNDKWYEFNDSSVYEVNSDKIYNYTPYLLIYKIEKED